MDKQAFRNPPVLCLKCMHIISILMPKKPWRVRKAEGRRPTRCGGCPQPFHLQEADPPRIGRILLMS